MTSQAGRKPPARRIRGRWLKRGLTLAFFSLVLYLLVSNAKDIAWGDVLESLHRRPLASLLPAALLAASSFAVYSCYDLLSRRYTGHRLSTPQVLSTTFISYAFNLNLGSLVGGVGFRHRLYSRLGLGLGEINRIVAFSMLTNWIGYVLLAGLVFLTRPLDIPENWALGSGALQVAGGILVALVAAYLLACAFSRRRTWQMRGHEIELPGFGMACSQIAISSLNWLLIASVVHLLLRQEVAYPTVLAVLLIAAIAGVLTHVPAGLGVLEAVFVTLLSPQVPTRDLLAALLAYRGIYYLAPLAVAAALYLVLEARFTRRNRGPERSPRDSDSRLQVAPRR